MEKKECISNFKLCTEESDYLCSFYPPLKRINSEEIMRYTIYFGEDLKRGDIINSTYLSNNISSKKSLPKQDFKQIKTKTKSDCNLARENRRDEIFPLELE